ncbi:hypothetical protein ACSBR2_005572 [Camellia fascicularis]
MNAEKLKLNTDGSFGGLIRDERGAWVCGYYGKLQPRTSLEAELWALYKELTIILQQGLNDVIIETNATQVVQLMEEEIGDKCPFKNIVEDRKMPKFCYEDATTLSNVFGKKVICVLMHLPNLEQHNRRICW